MSFCAIAANHPIALKLQTTNRELQTFISECNQLGTSEEAIEKAEKKGFYTGLKIIHPFDGREVPLYVANFVLMDYGTGAIFGCPAHDARDFEFATKYGLPILEVVRGQGAGIGKENPDPRSPIAEPYLGDGILVNSDFLNGLSVNEAKKKAIEALSKIGIGEEKINYRLRDWGISRQRYWGCPIPVIHCKDCGVVPVPEKDLPVVLPRDVTFDKPGNPLARHPSWKHVPCPACGKPAERETDTFDTFFESSWYFARFATLPSSQPLEASTVKKWLPVDCYIGGIEHAVLHLLYSRFFMRALAKCGYEVPPEPFKRLETQGMICHETYKSAEGKWLSPDEVGLQGAGVRDQRTNDSSTPDPRPPTPLLVEIATGKPVTVGRIEKMSKSKKNTVDPRHIIESYGADAARLFMLSDSPPDRDLEWTDAGIEGAWKYIQRVWRLVGSVQLADGSEKDLSANCEPQTTSLRQKTHKTIAAVTEDIEKFHFNKAIARIRELTNMMEESQGGAREALEAALHLICPFLPHLAEECWQQLGHKDELSKRPWPKADPAFLVDDEVTIAIQINGKTRTTIQLAKDIAKEAAEAKVMELQTVRDALKDKEIKKIIVVPNRIVNVVAS
jgi:leucyl-tRNA synthetase